MCGRAFGAGACVGLGFLDPPMSGGIPATQIVRPRRPDRTQMHCQSAEIEQGAYLDRVHRAGPGTPRAPPPGSCRSNRSNREHKSVKSPCEWLYVSSCSTAQIGSTSRTWARRGVCFPLHDHNNRQDKSRTYSPPLLRPAAPSPPSPPKHSTTRPFTRSRHPRSSLLASQNCR